MKTQYRIVHRKVHDIYGSDGPYYFVQRRYWWWPFWLGSTDYPGRGHATLDAAKAAISRDTWELRLDEHGKEVREVEGNYLLRPME